MREEEEKRESPIVGERAELLVVPNLHIDLPVARHLRCSYEWAIWIDPTAKEWPTIQARSATTGTRLDAKASNPYSAVGHDLVPFVNSPATQSREESI